MPDVIAESYVKIGYQDLKGLDSQIDKTGRKFVQEFDKMESKTKKVSSAFSSLASIIAAVGLTKFSADIISAATKMDSMNKSLLSIEKSQNKVNERMAQFKEIAKDPGLGLKQMTDGYIRLVNASVKADTSIKLMRELGNAIALVGGGAEQLDRVTYQFAQMSSKGKVMAEDLMVISDSLPQIRKLMQEAFGTADTEKLQKMGVNAETFISKITEQMGHLERAQTGAKNAQDNFNDAMFQFKASLGEAVLPAMTSVITKLTEMAEKFTALPDGIQKVIGTGVIGGTGLLGITVALKSIIEIVPKVIEGLKAISTSSLFLNISPWALGMGAAATAGYYLGPALANAFYPPPPSYGGPLEKKSLSQVAEEVRKSLGGTGELFSITRPKGAPIDYTKLREQMPYMGPFSEKAFSDILSGRYYSELEKRPIVPYEREIIGGIAPELTQPNLIPISESIGTLNSIKTKINLIEQLQKESEDYVNTLWKIGESADRTNEKQLIWQESLKEQGRIFTDNGVLIEDYNKALIWMANNEEKVREEAEKLELTWSKAMDTWEDLKKETDKAVDTPKEMSENWKIATDYIDDAYSRVIDKIFTNTRQTWRQLLEGMLRDYAITLAKMEGMSLINKATSNVSTGKSIFEGLGETGAIASAVSGSGIKSAGIGAGLMSALGPTAVASIVSFGGGYALGAYKPTTSEQRGWLGKWVNVTNPFLAWGIRAGSHQATGGNYSNTPVTRAGGEMNLNIFFPNADPNSINPQIFKQKVQVAIRELRQSGDL